MRIMEVRVRARDIAAQRAFYATTLGLPVSGDPADALTVHAGASRLVFEAAARGDCGDGDDPLYHIAFTIPRNKLATAKEWLATRTPLLARGGQDEFGSEAWDARQVYFRDPAGNIMELIARQTIPNDAPGAFGPDDLLCVSEIGLPVDDVPTRATALMATLGIAPYKEHSDAFAPLGDDQGLFIVVAVGRPWQPTDDAYAAAAPMRVVVSGTSVGACHMPGLPYDIVGLGQRDSS